MTERGAGGRVVVRRSTTISTSSTMRTNSVSGSNRLQHPGSDVLMTHLKLMSGSRHVASRASITAAVQAASITAAVQAARFVSV